MKLQPEPLRTLQGSMIPSDHFVVVFESDIVPSYRCSNPAHGPVCWVGEDGRHLIRLSFKSGSGVR